MTLNSNALAVGITAFILVVLSIIAAIMTYVSRRRLKSTSESEEEGTATELAPPVPPKTIPINAASPGFVSKKSASRFPGSSLPTIPQSPGLLVPVTIPGTHRKASNDSLPSVETVLERYEAEADADAVSRGATETQAAENTIQQASEILFDQTEEKKSLWERRKVEQCEEPSESKEHLIQKT